MGADDPFLMSLPLWRIGTENRYLPSLVGDERLALLFTDEDLARQWAEKACLEWVEMAQLGFRPIMMPTWADVINFLETFEKAGCHRVAIDQSAGAPFTRILDIGPLLRDVRLAEWRDKARDY